MTAVAATFENVITLAQRAVGVESAWVKFGLGLIVVTIVRTPDVDESEVLSSLADHFRVVAEFPRVEFRFFEEEMSDG